MNSAARLGMEWEGERLCAPPLRLPRTDFGKRSRAEPRTPGAFIVLASFSFALRRLASPARWPAPADCPAAASRPRQTPASRRRATTGRYLQGRWPDAPTLRATRRASWPEHGGTRADEKPEQRQVPSRDAGLVDSDFPWQEGLTASQKRHHPHPRKSWRAFLGHTEPETSLGRAFVSAAHSRENSQVLARHLASENPFWN